MATQSAGELVAGIPELLEHILLDLDSSQPSRNDERDMMCTLLRLLGVSHSFRNTIVGSLKLRRKLYGVACDAKHEIGTWNPLLRAKLRVRAPDGHVYRIIRKCAPSTESDCGIAEVVFQRCYASRAYGQYKLAAEGSWRKMYLWRSRHEVVRVATDTGFTRKVSLANPTIGEVYDKVFVEGMPLSQSMTARSYHKVFAPV